MLVSRIALGKKEKRLLCGAEHQKQKQGRKPWSLKLSENLQENLSLVKQQSSCSTHRCINYGLGCVHGYKQSAHKTNAIEETVNLINLRFQMYEF